MFLKALQFCAKFKLLTILTGEKVKDVNIIQTPDVKKEKSGPEPIIIPIILKMAEFDHKVCHTLHLLSMTGKIITMVEPCVGMC